MIQIFEPDDPRVRSGQYDIYGFTAKERKARARKHATQRQCDHTFIDSARCLKCGWTPPPTGGSSV